MSTLNELFGELRTLLAHTGRDERWVNALLEFVTKAHALSPRAYAEQWVPYMSQDAHTWPAPLRELDSIPTFERFADLLPDARFTLDLSNRSVTREDVLRLAASPSAAALIELLAPRRVMGAAEARAISSSAHFANLERLDVLDTEIGDEGVIAIAHSPHLRRLTELRLDYVGLGRRGVEALMQSRVLASVRELFLPFNPGLGDEGAVSIARSQHLERLDALHLYGCALGVTGVTALARAPTLSALRALDLSDNDVGDEGARELARSPHLRQLERLRLFQCGITDAGAIALANSPNLRNLQSLDLTRNSIQRPGALAIASSPFLSDTIRERWRRGIEEGWYP